MKKLKFLTLAAIAAATAMVSSCSDNGDLSTPAKETKGKCDLLVDVSVDGSRASALTGTNFSTFKLFGYQNPPTGSSAAAKGFLDGANGVDFTGTIGSTWTTESEALWPAETDQSNNFYAISTYGYDETEAGIINSATLGSEINTAGLQNGSFTYTSTISSYTPDYLNEAEYTDQNQLAIDKTPTSYVDAAKQKDVVVAASMETLKGSTGKITLPFKHAFAYITMEMNFSELIAKKNESGEYTDETESNGIDASTMCAIDYIAIHGVKTNGTFTFTKSGDSWEGSWDASDYGVVKYVWGMDNPLILTCSTETPTATNPIIYTPILTDGQAMMIIPQKVNNDGAIDWTAYDPADTPEGKAYIEVHACFWGNIDEEHSITPYKYIKTNGGTVEDASYLVPIGSTDGQTYLTTSIYYAIPEKFEFKKNKHYNIRMNLRNFMLPDGTGLLDEALDND